MWKRRAYPRLYVAGEPVCGFPLQAQGLELGVVCKVVLSKGQLHIAALQSQTLPPSDMLLCMRADYQLFGLISGCLTDWLLRLAAGERQAGRLTLPETEMVVEEFVDIAPIWMEVSPPLAVATGMSFDSCTLELPFATCANSVVPYAALAALAGMGGSAGEVTLNWMP